MRPMEKRPSRLFIVDFDVVGFSGHFFNQVLGFREAASASGLEPQVFVPQSADPKIAAALDADAILPDVIWHVADRDTALESFAEAHIALRVLWNAIKERGVSARDILLITSSRPAVIHALGAWLSTVRSQSIPAVFFRFFGPEFLNFHTMDYNDQAWTIRYASRELASKRGEERVFFTINNRELLASLEALTSRRAFFMPVPKYYADVERVRRAGDAGPATIYVHANRAGEMPRRIAAAAALILRQRTGVKFLVRFCKHAGAGETAHEAIDQRLIGNGLELLPTEEDHLQYLAAIERSQIVLLPYEPVEYRGVASGPFCEAAAQGKVVVAPGGTWMANQIAEGHAAGVLFAEPTAEDMAAAIARALHELPGLQWEALSVAEAFRAENSCRRNLELMLDLAGQPQDMRLSSVPPTGFASTFMSRGYLRKGWSHTEPGWGVWTDGSVAELAFRIRPSPEPLILRVHLQPFIVRQRPELRVRVCANGSELAEWHFSMDVPADLDWCWREATIPADIAASGDVRVTLHIDRPASPSEFGLSDDARQLGVVLRELSLTAVAGLDGVAPADAAKNVRAS
jgi:hypothetical protein